MIFMYIQPSVDSVDHHILQITGNKWLQTHFELSAGSSVETKDLAMKQRFHKKHKTPKNPPLFARRECHGFLPWKIRNLSYEIRLSVM